MRKKPEITEKTKNKFIEVFCDLYRVKPIEKITVQEITRLSGYNRSTFYQYFNDIYDLVEYLENEILNLLENEQINKAQILCYLEIEDINDIEDIKNENEYIYRIAHLYDEKGNWLSALLGDYGSVRFTDKVKVALESRMNELPLGIENKVLEPYIKDFALFGIITLFRCWQKNDKSISSKELVMLIRNLVFKGISSQVQLHHRKDNEIDKN